MDLDSKKGIMLDLGCGGNKHGKGWVGMDVRQCPGVDIVWDVRETPFRIGRKLFPKDSCHRILMSHLWEHIPPDRRMALMDECWRIMKPGGQLMISSPYWLSLGANQDPTHYSCPNEATFQYFDPEANPVLYGIYQPKPWRLVRNDFNPTGNVQIIMEARK